MQNRRVAVFMPTARCRKWLCSAIDSIIHQTYPHTELYVVDDAGGDVNGELTAQYPGVNFLRMKTAHGPYFINNLLLQLTDSEFVAFQDADDTSHIHRFEAQIKYIDSDALDGCGTWAVNRDESGEPLGFDTFSEAVTASVEGGDLYPLLHPSTLFHRHVFQALGGFDGGTRFGADTEFLFRCCRQFSIGNVQQLLYYHMVHPSSLTQSPETGFKSTERKIYSDELMRSINEIREGLRTDPAPGVLLNGRVAGLESMPEFELIQLGRGNTTWRGLLNWRRIIN
jgi:glycosyltransferase involved in cell wall biosynthesis